MSQNIFLAELFINIPLTDGWPMPNANIYLHYNYLVACTDIFSSPHWSINIANKFLNQKYSIFVIRIFPDQKFCHHSIISNCSFRSVCFSRKRKLHENNCPPAAAKAHSFTHSACTPLSPYIPHPLMENQSLLSSFFPSIHYCPHSFLLPHFPLTSNLGPKREGGKKEEMAKATKAILLFCWLMCSGYARKEEEMGKLFMRCLGPTNTQNSLGTQRWRRHDNGIMELEELVGGNLWPSPVSDILHKWPFLWRKGKQRE